MARALALAVVIFGLSSTGSAFAQPAPTLTQGLPPAQGPSIGDAAGTAGDPVGRLAFEPLRLSLMGSQPLVPTNQCGDSFATARTTGDNQLRMGTFGTNLLGGSSPRSPRLSLFGFSRFGCPLDGAVGTGLTFTVPLSPKVFFALSGGAIYLPATGAATVMGRADLVFPQKSGRSFNVGIGTRGVSFGGIF